MPHPSLLTRFGPREVSSILGAVANAGVPLHGPSTEVPTTLVPIPLVTHASHMPHAPPMPAGQVWDPFGPREVSSILGAVANAGVPLHGPSTEVPTILVPIPLVTHASHMPHAPPMPAGQVWDPFGTREVSSILGAFAKAGVPLHGPSKKVPSILVPIPLVTHTSHMPHAPPMPADQFRPPFGPREVSSILWAVAKAGVPLHGPSKKVPSPPARGPPVSGRRRVEDSLHASSSAAAVGPRVPLECVEMLSRRALQQLPQFNGQDVSMTLWAIANIVDDAQLQRQLQYNVLQQPGGAWTGEQEGGETLESVSGLARPKIPLQLKALVQAIVASSKERLGELGAQSLSNSIWALARLGIRPDDEWLAAAVERSSALMVLSNTAWALVVFEYSPPPSWVQAFLSYCRISMAHATPQAVTQMAWAAARLHLSPDAAWFHTLLQNMTLRIGSYNPQVDMGLIMSAASQLTSAMKPIDACLIIWSLASLGYAPSPPVMQRLLDSVARNMSECVATVASKLDECGPQEIANLWWALASLDFCPASSAVLAELADEVLQYLPLFEA
eukprot:gene3991-14071_t